VSGTARGGPGGPGGGLGPLSPEFLTELFRDPLDPGYAEAATAARKRRPGGPWRRGATRVLTLATLVVIGVLFAMSYRQVVQDEPARSQIRTQLVEEIHEQEATTEALEERFDDLRGEVAQLRDRELGGQQARRLRELEAVTGLAQVTGEGAVVEITDGPEQVDPVTGEPVLEARIQDYDLRLIANALWAEGAEAVAINDRRLTATSTVRNASGAILVNRRPVGPPYQVTAVGPDDLAQRFLDSTVGRYLQALSGRYGISYDIRAEDDLTLPAAASQDLHHATPSGPSSTGGDR
jgi:uncharacterized protein YlxW (UPF0749 family)